MSVGIDAMVLIWGLKKAYRKKKPTTQDVVDMRARAMILFENLSDTHETTIIPTVAVSELLRGIEPEDHGSFVEALQQRFSIHSFDLPSASLAARLWRIAQIPSEANPPERGIIKADLMIIATVRTAGASLFYRHDPWCRKMVEKAGLVAKDLPAHSENLFNDYEARKEAEEDSN